MTTPAPGRPAEDAGIPGDLDHDLVAVIDGPLAGQWFTWPDWQQRIRSARYMAQRTSHRSSVLDYRPAGFQIDHPDPRVIGVRGWAATSRPTDVRETDPYEHDDLPHLHRTHHALDDEDGDDLTAAG